MAKDYKEFNGKRIKASYGTGLYSKKAYDILYALFKFSEECHFNYLTGSRSQAAAISMFLYLDIDDDGEIVVLVRDKIEDNNKSFEYIRNPFYENNDVVVRQILGKSLKKILSYEASFLNQRGVHCPNVTYLAKANKTSEMLKSPTGYNVISVKDALMLADFWLTPYKFAEDLLTEEKKAFLAEIIGEPKDDELVNEIESKRAKYLAMQEKMHSEIDQVINERNAVLNYLEHQYNQRAEEIEKSYKKILEEINPDKK